MLRKFISFIYQQHIKHKGTFKNFISNFLLISYQFSSISLRNIDVILCSDLVFGDVYHDLANILLKLLDLNPHAVILMSNTNRIQVHKFKRSEGIKEALLKKNHSHYIYYTRLYIDTLPSNLCTHIQCIQIFGVMHYWNECTRLTDYNVHNRYVNHPNLISTSKLEKIRPGAFWPSGGRFFSSN